MKKLTTITVSLFIAAAVLGAAVPVAKAALTETQISAIITLLSSFGADQTTINNVNASLRGQATTTPVTTGTGACTGITFSRNLSKGMSGADVKCMQVLLNSSADTQIAASGAGSPGSETLNFGSLTLAAAKKLQAKNTLPTTGFVGPLTRAVLNAMLGTTPTPTPGPTIAPVGGAVSVSLDSSNPVSTSIIADSTAADGAQALAPMLTLRFSTAPGTSAVVTSLKIKRIGISSDSDVFCKGRRHEILIMEFRFIEFDINSDAFSNLKEPFSLAK